MTTSRALVVRAPAKINRTLRILGRRQDGYHELETEFQALDLHDTVTFVESPGPFRLRCSAPHVPLDRTNLVWRAAEALWRHAHGSSAPRNVTVTIDKQIPIGGGLGGGSSDAAAALVAFARLWRLPVARKQMTAIAASLGADVPFFLVGGFAFGRGRGDRLTRARDGATRRIVLLVPSFSVSTADAYTWYASDRSDAIETATRVAGATPRGRAVNEVNDLEAPVARRHPEILRMTAALRRAGAVSASLSGSGATVFGLFGSKRAAEAAVAGLRRSAWSLLLTRTLTRGEYRRLVAPRWVRLPRLPAT